MKSHPRAGNANLKGKKYKLLSCKCCVIQDFRDRDRNKQAKKEIRDGIGTPRNESFYSRRSYC